MAYFNRDTSNRSGRDNRGGGRGFGGGRDRGGSSFGRGGDDRPREMFKTVCSNCGKDCEVPFRPTSGKPVYCSDCFEKMGGRNSDGPRPERNDRFDRPERPERNRSDFGPRPVQTVDYKQSFDALSAKLDKIITLLTPQTETVVPVVVAAPVEKEVKVVKTPKVKKAKIVKEEVAE